MDTFSALLALCAGNSPVPPEFASQRPVTRNFKVVFDLYLIKRLSKQSVGWWFEAPTCPLWRHCNEELHYHDQCIKNIHNSERNNNWKQYVESHIAENHNADVYEINNWLTPSCSWWVSVEEEGWKVNLLHKVVCIHEDCKIMRLLAAHIVLLLTCTYNFCRSILSK